MFCVFYTNPAYAVRMSVLSADVCSSDLCIDYDCMDALATFKGAPPELLPLEQRLLSQADLVFTGGYSLYEAKKDRHGHVYPFPSSVDAAHFAQARSAPIRRPDDSRPTLGLYGVVDERMAAVGRAHGCTPGPHATTVR